MFSKRELDFIANHFRKWGVIPPTEQLTASALLETLAAAAAASNGGCYLITVKDGNATRVATVTVEFRPEV